MRRLWIAAALAVLLAGCRTSIPWKPDVIVDIPLNPTRAVTQPVTEPPPIEGSAPETLPAWTLPPQTQPETQPPVVTRPPDPAPEIAADIQACRQAAGLEELTLDEGLCAIAAIRAGELAVRWSHTRPDGSEWQTLLARYGYGSTGAAESLWFGTDGSEAVARWMAAGGENILGDFHAFGVGSHITADGLIYVAVIFTGNP